MILFLSTLLDRFAESYSGVFGCHRVTGGTGFLDRLYDGPQIYEHGELRPLVAGENNGEPDGKNESNPDEEDTPTEGGASPQQSAERTESGSESADEEQIKSTDDGQQQHTADESRDSDDADSTATSEASMDHDSGESKQGGDQAGRYDGTITALEDS